MKAILVNEKQDLVWADVPNPVIKEDEVLVKIYAAGVNRADLLQRQGNYPPPPGCPEWMGLEISGVIEECGAAVTGWKVGDKVCALLGGGGYAEYVSVKQDMLMPIPKGLSLEEAAALPEAYATSYLNLFLEGHLQPGQTAFIPAGSSGLASVAIPMAKAFGARVITTIRVQEKAEKIASLGADLIINTSTQSLEEVLQAEEAQGRPIHVAMDCVSGDMVGKCLPYMARGGYWIVIATLSGVETTVPLRFLLTKGLHLVGSTLRSRAPEYKAEILAQLVATLWPKIESGEVRPLIHKILPITEAEEAHRILQRSENIGKVILTLPH